MRKILDWIADKLGYQRKYKNYTWTLGPSTHDLMNDIFDPTTFEITQELLGDCLLLPMTEIEFTDYPKTISTDMGKLTIEVKEE